MAYTSGLTALLTSLAHKIPSRRRRSGAVAPRFESILGRPLLHHVTAPSLIFIFTRYHSLACWDILWSALLCNLLALSHVGRSHQNTLVSWLTEFAAQTTDNKHCLHSALHPRGQGLARRVSVQRLVLCTAFQFGNRGDIPFRAVAHETAKQAA